MFELSAICSNSTAAALRKLSCVVETFKSHTRNALPCKIDLSNYGAAE